MFSEEAVDFQARFYDLMQPMSFFQAGFQSGLPGSIYREGRLRAGLATEQEGPGSAGLPSGDVESQRDLALDAVFTFLERSSCHTATTWQREECCGEGRGVKVKTLKLERTECDLVDAVTF